MSIRLMSRAWDSNLPTTDKFVLLALADWSNDAGHCWPSVAQLQAKCSLSERTVQAALKRLDEAGLISRDMRAGKGTLYRVMIPETPAADAPPQEMPPAADAPTPAADAPNTPLTPIPLVSSNDDTPPKPSPVKLLEAWNATAERIGLPKAKTLDATRERKARSLIKTRTIEDITEAIAAVERSPFCRGENDRCWKADFDFLLQPKSFNRLIEGFYG